jgi:hypothetical protein
MFCTGTVATPGRRVYQNNLGESGPLGQVIVIGETQNLYGLWVSLSGFR